jgi:tetratricopeptide (TPR) repeat protein
MRTAHRITAALGVGLLGSFPLFCAETLSDKQIDQLLDEGRRVIAQGIPDTAIKKDIDPVIAEFERRYAKETRVIYVTHGLAESIVYMGMSGVADGKSGKKRGAIAIQGSWTDALVMKGYALFELRRPDEGKSVLRRAIELSPLYPPPWNELGALYQQEKDWPAALDAYQNAEDGTQFMAEGAEKTAMLTRAWRGKGFVLTEQGKLDESEALYKKCLALDADDGGAKRELEYIQSLRNKAKSTTTP